MNSIDNLLHQLDFKKSFTVQGRSSVADLFSKSNRCGIYILHFANDEYYVGQAVDVVRRYSQHRHTHLDIEKISYKRVGKRRLDVEEKEVVKALESQNLKLRNILLTTFPYAETDFDLIMPKYMQERWLQDLSFRDLEGERVVDDDLRRKYASRYQQFTQLPHAEEVTQILRKYVQNCIPAVKRGEISFWSCSCLPGNSKTLYTRLNLGWQTVFEVFVHENTPHFMWYVTRRLAEKILDTKLHEVNKDTELVYSEIEEFPGLKFYVSQSPLSKGGQDQVYITVQGVEYAEMFVEDSHMIESNRTFNLGLVKKGPCPWGRNHCLDLADRLVE